MYKKELVILKEFLAALEIIKKIDSAENEKAGSGDKKMFLQEIEKMEYGIITVQKVFEKLGIEYKHEYMRREGEVNIIQEAVKKHIGYAANAARSDLVPLIKGVIKYIEEGLTEEKIADSFIPDKDFSFIVKPELKKIIENDYKEVYKCLMAECYKATMVLAGGLIEGILLDLLSQHIQKALQSTKAPGDKQDIEKWDLYNLIEVSVDLGLVSGIEKIGHGVRDFRNIIHPGKQLKENLEVKPEEAKIAIEVLNIIIRQLSQSIPNIHSQN